MKEYARHVCATQRLRDFSEVQLRRLLQVGERSIAEHGTIDGDEALAIRNRRRECRRSGAHARQRQQ
jgi:hypothetical protein